MTKTWIIKNAHTILTMDDTRRELNGHDILLRDGVIAEIGENLSIPAGAEIVDAQNAVVTPGLVNTHHHLYQSLTRAVPGGRMRCCLVVANPFPDLGRFWSSRDARFREAGAKPTCPIWLHDEFGSLVPVPKRRAP